MTEFPKLEKKLDAMGLVVMIKKLVYAGGNNNRNARHKKAREKNESDELVHGQIQRHPRIKVPVHGHEKCVRQIGSLADARAI